MTGLSIKYSSHRMTPEDNKLLRLAVTWMIEIKKQFPLTKYFNYYEEVDRYNNINKLHLVQKNHEAAYISHNCYINTV